jgi:hypothetical protein
MAGTRLGFVQCDSDEDAMIAATAQVHKLTVVTCNVADFKPFGVKVLNPFCHAAQVTTAQGVVIENLPLNRFAPVSLCGTLSKKPVPWFGCPARCVPAKRAVMVDPSSNWYVL